jgi:hypothetical protein
MKLLIAIGSLVLLTTGCTTTARMDFAGLNQFRIDCSKKQEQLDFLRSQWPSESEQLISNLMVTSTTGYILSNADGTYQDRMYLQKGAYTSVLRKLIYDVKRTCPN